VLGFHWLWYYSFGAISLMSVAGIAGLMMERPAPQSVDGLTYWTRRRELLPSEKSRRADSTAAPDFR
jgi:hypothetical protein